MKIYTKKGDTGQTSLIGGTKVPKHHIRIEAYGTVDELNSFIGNICNYISNKKALTLLGNIQNQLFIIGSILASDESSRMQLPQIPENAVTALEAAIDEINEHLPPLKNFIIPGGSKAASASHIARCVCRRAERAITNLATETNVDPIIISYINRLSDYLFMLARYLLHSEGLPEIPWKS